MPAVSLLSRLGVTADTSRYGTFCSLVLEACLAVGEHLQVLNDRLAELSNSCVIEMFDVHIPPHDC